jgi:tetratricopeptide (TPR) repeat protein
MGLRTDMLKLRLAGSAIAVIAACFCSGAANADDYDWTKDSPACTDLSNPEAAIVACSRIISAADVPSENLSYFYLDRGRAFARLQKWDEAHKDLTLAVERNIQEPDRHARAEFDLQVVRVKLGHYQAAREGFWKFTGEPDTGRASWAVWALTSDPEIGETDSARLVKAARALVARDDARVLTHRLLGLTLAAAGKPDEAVAEIKKAHDMVAANVAGSSLEKNLQSYALKAMQADIEMIKAGRPIITDVTEFLD